MTFICFIYFFKTFRNLFQNDFSKVCRAMEIGSWQRNGLPTEEMRFASFVSTLVEVDPEHLRKNGFGGTEDERERYLQLNVPFEQSVLLLNGLAWEGTPTPDKCHLSRRKGLHIFGPSQAPRSDHCTDTIGFKIHIMLFTGHLAEELYARVLPYRTLVLSRERAQLGTFDVIVQKKRIMVVGHVHTHVRFLRKSLRPVDLVDWILHRNERMRDGIRGCLLSFAFGLRRALALRGDGVGRECGRGYALGTESYSTYRRSASR